MFGHKWQEEINESKIQKVIEWWIWDDGSRPTSICNWFTSWKELVKKKIKLNQNNTSRLF